MKKFCCIKYIKYLYFAESLEKYLQSFSLSYVIYRFFIKINSLKKNSSEHFILKLKISFFCSQPLLDSQFTIEGKTLLTWLGWISHAFLLTIIEGTYKCESNISLSKWNVTRNYAFRPFNLEYIGYTGYTIPYNTMETEGESSSADILPYRYSVS